MMPLDYDLMWTLMLRFEQGDFSVPEGVPEKTAAYHVAKLKEAGLVEATIIDGPDPGRKRPLKYIMRDLTYPGHQWIANIRKNQVWEKVKEHSVQRAIELSFDSIQWIVKNLGL